MQNVQRVLFIDAAQIRLRFERPVDAEWTGLCRYTPYSRRMSSCDTVSPLNLWAFERASAADISSDNSSSSTGAFSSDTASGSTSDFSNPEIAANLSSGSTSIIQCASSRVLTDSKSVARPAPSLVTDFVAELVAIGIPRSFEFTTDLISPLPALPKARDRYLQKCCHGFRSRSVAAPRHRAVLPSSRTHSTTTPALSTGPGAS